MQVEHYQANTGSWKELHASRNKKECLSDKKCDKKKCDKPRWVRGLVLKNTATKGKPCSVEFAWNEGKATWVGNPTDERCRQIKPNAVWWINPDGQRVCGVDHPNIGAPGACTGVAKPSNIEVCKYAPESWFGGLGGGGGGGGGGGRRVQTHGSGH